MLPQPHRLQRRGSSGNDYNSSEGASCCFSRNRVTMLLASPVWSCDSPGQTTARGTNEQRIPQYQKAECLTKGGTKFYRFVW